MKAGPATTALLHTCDGGFQKRACDALRCKFQNVQYFAPDFGISQLFIIRFSNGLQHCDGDALSFQVIFKVWTKLNTSNYHRSIYHRRRTQNFPS